MDRYDNVSTPLESASITLDTTKPGVSGTLNFTRGINEIIPDWAGAFTELNGIAKYTLYYSTLGTPAACSGATLPLSGDTATSYDHSGLTPGKIYYYRVCAADLAGNISTVTGKRKAAAELVPPTGSISINRGAAYTKSASVTLSLSATDASGVAWMCISNTGACSAWTAYATGKAWTLPAGDGEKKVYVSFMDRYDNVSTPLESAPIILDTTKPTGSILINNGDVSTANQNVTLNLSAVDNLSSEDSISLRFSNNNSTWSAWEAYGALKQWILTSGKGNKTVYVQFRDGAGNVSSTYSDTITLN
jgi:hypothetical protein